MINVHQPFLLVFCSLALLPYKTVPLKGSWLEFVMVCIMEYATVLITASLFQSRKEESTSTIRGMMICLGALFVHYTDWLLVPGIILTLAMLPAREKSWSYYAVAFTMFYLRMGSTLMLTMTLVCLVLALFSLNQ